jgi:choline dehydrogenase-like flavoprotein
MPGVGLNLQDHFYIHTGWRATPDSSYNANLSGLRKYWEGFKYLLTRRGYLALGSSQVVAFVKSSRDEPRADLQISFRPMTFQYFPDGTVRVENQPGMGVSVYQLRPRTTGTVTLRSARAQDKAACSPCFLTDAYDIGAMISGIRQIRQIMNAPPMAARVLVLQPRSFDQSRYFLLKSATYQNQRGSALLRNPLISLGSSKSPGCSTSRDAPDCARCAQCWSGPNGLGRRPSARRRPAVSGRPRAG